MISQSAMESFIYKLCKQVRNMDVETLKRTLQTDPIVLPKLENPPILNQQNRPKIKVVLALITEIVASAAEKQDYLLNHPNIEIEHIWANHFDDHKEEFADINTFSAARNNIGDLLLLKKRPNASLNDAPYAYKVEQYFSHNILAQSLNKKSYQNNPAFLDFIKKSGLPFQAYDEFKLKAITERAELYKQILLWNWNEK